MNLNIGFFLFFCFFSDARAQTNNSPSSSPSPSSGSGSGSSSNLGSSSEFIPFNFSGAVFTCKGTGEGTCSLQSPPTQDASVCDCSELSKTLQWKSENPVIDDDQRCQNPRFGWSWELSPDDTDPIVPVLPPGNPQDVTIKGADKFIDNVDGTECGLIIQDAFQSAVSNDNETKTALISTVPSSAYCQTVESANDQTQSDWVKQLLMDIDETCNCSKHDPWYWILELSGVKAVNSTYFNGATFPESRPRNDAELIALLVQLGISWRPSTDEYTKPKEFPCRDDLILLWMLEFFKNLDMPELYRYIGLNNPVEVQNPQLQIYGNLIFGMTIPPDRAYVQNNPETMTCGFQQFGTAFPQGPNCNLWDPSKGESAAPNPIWKPKDPSKPWGCCPHSDYDATNTHKTGTLDGWVCRDFCLPAFDAQLNVKNYASDNNGIDRICNINADVPAGSYDGYSNCMCSQEAITYIEGVIKKWCNQWIDSSIDLYPAIFDSEKNSTVFDECCWKNKKSSKCDFYQPFRTSIDNSAIDLKFGTCTDPTTQYKEERNLFYSFGLKEGIEMWTHCSLTSFTGPDLEPLAILEKMNNDGMVDECIEFYAATIRYIFMATNASFLTTENVNIAFTRNNISSILSSKGFSCEPYLLPETPVTKTYKTSTSQQDFCPYPNTANNIDVTQSDGNLGQFCKVDRFYTPFVGGKFPSLQEPPRLKGGVPFYESNYVTEYFKNKKCFTDTSNLFGNQYNLYLVPCSFFLPRPPVAGVFSKYSSRLRNTSDTVKSDFTSYGTPYDYRPFEYDLKRFFETFTSKTKIRVPEVQRVGATSNFLAVYKNSYDFDTSKPPYNIFNSEVNTATQDSPDEPIQLPTSLVSKLFSMYESIIGECTTGATCDFNRLLDETVDIGMIVEQASVMGTTSEHPGVYAKPVTPNIRRNETILSPDKFVNYTGYQTCQDSIYGQCVTTGQCYATNDLQYGCNEQASSRPSEGFLHSIVYMYELNETSVSNVLATPLTNATPVRIVSAEKSMPTLLTAMSEMFGCSNTPIPFHHPTHLCMDLETKECFVEPTGICQPNHFNCGTALGYTPTTAYFEPRENCSVVDGICRRERLLLLQQCEGTTFGQCNKGNNASDFAGMLNNASCPLGYSRCNDKTWHYIKKDNDHLFAKNSSDFVFALFPPIVPHDTLSCQLPTGSHTFLENMTFLQTTATGDFGLTMKQMEAWCANQRCRYPFDAGYNLCQENEEFLCVLRRNKESLPDPACKDWIGGLSRMSECSNGCVPVKTDTTNGLFVLPNTNTGLFVKSQHYTNTKKEYNVTTLRLKTYELDSLNRLPSNCTFVASNSDCHVDLNTNMDIVTVTFKSDPETTCDSDYSTQGGLGLGSSPCPKDFPSCVTQFDPQGNKNNLCVNTTVTKNPLSGLTAYYDTKESIVVELDHPITLYTFRKKYELSLQNYVEDPILKDPLNRTYYLDRVTLETQAIPTNYTFTGTFSESMICVPLTYRNELNSAIFNAEMNTYHVRRITQPNCALALTLPGRFDLQGNASDNLFLTTNCKAPSTEVNAQNIAWKDQFKAGSFTTTRSFSGWYDYFQQADQNSENPPGSYILMDVDGILKQISAGPLQPSCLSPTYDSCKVALDATSFIPCDGVETRSWYTCMSNMMQFYPPLWSPIIPYLNTLPLDLNFLDVYGPPKDKNLPPCKGNEATWIHTDTKSNPTRFQPGQPDTITIKYFCQEKYK